MKLSKILNIKKSKSRCYDTTVNNNHNFFANKFLIHNCDYRGEIKIIMINQGDRNVQINVGDRIAQLLLAKVERANLVPVKDLPPTKRGDGGFGSTGTGLLKEYMDTTSMEYLTKKST